MMPHPLEPVLNPRSVAIVGASQDPTKRGFQTIRALQEQGYPGAIHPVNPRGGTILGLPVTASVAELPADVELALVCTPAAVVPEVLEACAARGIRGAVVLALGFAEAGGAGVALEARVREVARRTGLRVVGPNTSGILNLPARLNLIGARGLRPGRLALLVQSGNMALALMNEAAAAGEGISLCIGVGNQADLSFHDYLSYLRDDPGTAAIVMYVEGLRDGRAFLEEAERTTRVKPVVLLKGGRSHAGTAAARTHTGAVVGEYGVFRAAMRQAGVLEVGRTDELLAVGETLALQPPVRAWRGVAVLSDGGGHATLAADALSQRGVPLAHLAERTRARLRELLGPAAGVANPVDVAGATDASPAVFTDALLALLEDDAVGGVAMVGLFGGYAIRFAASLEAEERRTAAELAALAAGAGKPLVVHSLYATSGSEPLRVLREEGVPVAGSLEVACACIAAAWEWGRLRERASAPARRTPAAADDALAAARREGRTMLLEPEARALLERYGVALVPAEPAADERAAAAAAERLGAALALKVISPAIPHKTEAGGVALGVRGGEAAAAAFREIARSAAAYAAEQGTEPDVRGVLVARMLPPPVAELLVGARRDPDFGPVLVVGAGGTAVELMRDVAVRVLPVEPEAVVEALEATAVGRVLRGVRGGPAADARAVAELAVALGDVLLANPAVVEVEANPVFAYPDRAVAVDARAVVR
ncbi:MAG TPA: acetate--CoA ligase family protein [Longimicrobiales bacterium]|nr:acetate--CoA ligase family protein [Longimicrobiales bacterium]